ncbi:FG-GAP repeat domain-containing protein [Halochromatium roseum]|uniref:FG-GAP repeat domain-containing protein n=1 Tax=Halochromatium roseum TaxID=391920 RepID=UPI001913EFB6|nr:VCBS repeat-containing protein [Halochromatium roseum]
MNVVSSELSLASSHRYSRVETSTERLEINGRGRAMPSEAGQNRAGARPETGVSAVVLSGQGRALAAAEQASGEIGNAAGKGQATADAIESAAEEARKDPGNQLLIALVEYLTGKRIRLIDSKDCQPAECESGKGMESSAAAPNAISTAPETAPRGRQSDFSLFYERTHSLEEHESMHFSAEGVIRTADGKTIRFAVELGMQRSYREESRFELQMGSAAQREDPIVINFPGQSAQLRDQRFEFDLDADGDLESLPLLANGSGYLVYDRNGDGRVNDGSELFGALSGDGFADLKALDEDGNGWIDSADAATNQLYLWLPEAGGDGKLMTLEEAGVAAVSTSSIATPFELRGHQNADLGAVRSTGLYLSTDDTVGTTQQIDLSV